MKKTVILLSVLFFFSPVLALSQHKKQSIELYPYLSQEGFDENTLFKDIFLYGIRIGFNFSKTMEGEFLYSKGEGESSFYHTLFVDPYTLVETPQDVHEDKEMSHWAFHFLFNFDTPKEKIVPYAVAGVGRFRIIKEFDVFDSETGQPVYNNPVTGRAINRRDSQSSPSLTLGVGVRSYLTKRIAVRLELRAIKYRHRLSGLIYDTDIFEYGFKVIDKDYQDYHASAGLSILFGGREE